MSIAKGFILREVAGNFVVVAVGKKAKEFNAMISLNETGAFIWRLLEQDKSELEIVAELTKEYEVDEFTATQKVKEFVDRLKKENILD